MEKKGSATPFPFPSAQVPALLRSGAPRLGLHSHRAREEGLGERLLQRQAGAGWRTLL